MKNLAKFKKNYIYVLIVTAPMLLGGAKYWQDPTAIPPAQNCENGMCCASCIETASMSSPERMTGWEWKLRVASHYSR